MSRELSEVISVIQKYKQEKRNAFKEWVKSVDLNKIKTIDIYIGGTEDMEYTGNELFIENIDNILDRLALEYDMSKTGSSIRYVFNSDEDQVFWLEEGGFYVDYDWD